MSTRFSMRFVLADGEPTWDELRGIWSEGLELRQGEDEVVELWHEDRAVARLNRLYAKDARARALLAAIRQEATRYAEPEVVETVSFVLDHASGVVVARPVLGNEDDVERSLEPLDALWEHLFERHGGMLQVDGEGIYVEEGPLVELP